MAELRTFRIIAQNSTILLDDGKDGWILAGKLPAGLQAMGKLHRFVLNLMLYIRTVTRPLTFFIISAFEHAAVIQPISVWNAG